MEGNNNEEAFGWSVFIEYVLSATALKMTAIQMTKQVYALFN